jgi:hypothetical protein
MNKFLIITFFTTFTAFAQDCNCEKNFQWVKNTFEVNDAGFQFVIDKKGQAEYENHNRFYAEKVKKIDDVNECAKVLNEWTKFFRKGHLFVSSLKKSTPTETKKEIDTKNWEPFPMTTKELTRYFAKNDEKSFEGIWKMDNYTIAIVKKNEEYIGFILDAPNTNWKKNQVKLKLYKNKGSEIFGGKLFLRDYSTYEMNFVEMVGNNTIALGQFKLERVNPKVADSEQVAKFWELAMTDEPMFFEHSETTNVLRIPSFEWENKKAIDSIISANHEKIVSKPNFVIDIRDNGGGADSSFSSLIQYLYTNPIRVITVEMLSTELNNKRNEFFLNQDDVSENEKEEIRKEMKLLNDNLGKFVNLFGTNLFYQTREKVLDYPKNVAVLINEYNGSTAEQFLLAAKQSTKTKLFGKTTMGVLDISNMNFVTSDCGDIQLGYSMSKSLRIPHMTIDDKGIQPDYYLDDSIKQYEWIPFVEDTFNKK